MRVEACPRKVLVFYNIESKVLSLILPDVMEFYPIGKGNSGEVRLLLCYTKEEVYILDTRLLEIIEIITVVEDESI